MFSRGVWQELGEGARKGKWIDEDVGWDVCCLRGGEGLAL